MNEPQKDDQQTVAPVPSPDTLITPTNPNTVNAAPPATIPTPQVTVSPSTSEARQTETAPVEPESAPSETQVVDTEDSIENDDPDSIAWTAEEFHNHQKASSWYFILAIATIGVAAILYFWTRSRVTPVVVVICGVVLGIYAKRQPAPLQYMMDNGGIRVGSKQYSYDDFRLFIITTGAAPLEVTLIPVKRFMPSLSVRYNPEVENKVLDVLTQHLPFEERRPDLIDSLMHRIHF